MDSDSGFVLSPTMVHIVLAGRMIHSCNLRKIDKLENSNPRLNSTFLRPYLVVVLEVYGCWFTRCLKERYSYVTEAGKSNV
jgi:hypothetical protein